MDTKIVELAERIQKNLLNNSAASVETVDGSIEDYVIVNDNYHVIHVKEGFMNKWVAELFGLDMETEAVLKIASSSSADYDFKLLMNFINTTMTVNNPKS